MPEPMGPQFRLTREHLMLLRRMAVVWGADQPPFGAPTVCQKRPLLTTDPVSDVMRLLGLSGAAVPDDRMREHATRLYHETLYAMQIVMQFAGTPIELGVWRRDDTVHPKRWEQVG